EDHELLLMYLEPRGHRVERLPPVAIGVDLAGGEMHVGKLRAGGERRGGIGPGGGAGGVRRGRGVRPGGRRGRRGGGGRGWRRQPSSSRRPCPSTARLRRLAFANSRST